MPVVEYEAAYDRTFRANLRRLRHLIVVALLAGAGVASAAEPVTVGAGAAAVTLDMQPPRAVESTTGLVWVDAGVRLTSVSAARVRLEFFPLEDQLTKAVTLGVDLDRWRGLGLLGGAGVSGVELGRVGGVLTFGTRYRVGLGRSLDGRAELVGGFEQRSDFRGLPLGLGVGLEWEGPR